MQNYWLLKTEPSTYSFSDLLADKKTTWDGVKNNLALIHLRSMKKGDRAFIYHTGDEKKIVGIAEIISDPYPDPKQNDAKLTVIDLQPANALKNGVTLSTMKSMKEFQDFELIKISRLGVMPVNPSLWNLILQLSEADR